MKNLSQAGSFLFDDKDWIQKLLIGVAFMFLSIAFVGMPFLLGYLLQLSRRSAAGEKFPLPDWNDLPALLSKGLMFLVVYLIYAVPLAIIALLFLLIPGIGWFLAVTIPPLVLLIVLPYLTVNFARHGDIAIAFDIDGLLDFIRTNLNTVLICAVVSYLFFLISLFGVLALVVGVLFTYYWALLAAFYLFGQVFYEDEFRQRGETAGASDTIAPPPTSYSPASDTDSGVGEGGGSSVDEVDGDTERPSS